MLMQHMNGSENGADPQQRVYCLLEKQATFPLEQNHLKGSLSFFLHRPTETFEPVKSSCCNVLILSSG